MLGGATIYISVIAYPSYYQRWYAADAAAETADAATEMADTEAETADAAAETTALDHGHPAKMDWSSEESMALAPSLEAR